MKFSLSEFITELNLGKKSGLLSVSVKSANTLLKIYFRDGDIYHVTFGNHRGSKSIEQVTKFELAEYIFIPDISMNISDTDLPPVTAIAELFRNGTAAGGVSSASGTAERPAAAGGSAFSSAATVQERLKTALVRQIGPAGTKVMAKIVSTQWHAPATPGREDYLRLVDLMKAEIENADDQNEFVKEAKTFLP